MDIFSRWSKIESTSEKKLAAAVSRDLPSLLSSLGIDEADLAVFSEKQIDDSLAHFGISLPAEIVAVKNAWKKQRQHSGELFNFLSIFCLFFFGVFFLLF